MRPLRVLAVGALLAPCFCAPLAIADEITIAGWNIAANAHTITSDVEKEIAKGISLLESDIVGLTEVKDEARMTMGSATARKAPEIRVSQITCGDLC